MPQSFVKVDIKHHFKETCFNHVNKTSFFRELEKLGRKQVNSTARSADMAERRAAKHCCLRWNLWVVSFNWKSVFNLATVGPILMISTPMIFQFRSNAEKIKARAHRWAPARKKRITRLTNFGKFWPKCWSGSLLKVAGIGQQYWGQIWVKNSREIPDVTPKIWQKCDLGGPKIGQVFFAHFC